MFKNFLKIITCGAIVLCTNLHAADAGMGGVGPLTFSDADWAEVPVLGELSSDDVMNLFSGPIENSGREWSLDSFDNDDLRAVVKDRQFDVKTLMDETVFAHQPFSVDSEGYLRYKVYLASRTKILPSEEDDSSSFALCAEFSITTKLTDEELANPIVKALQSSLSFEQQRKFFRENREEFERTEGMKNAGHFLIFAQPSRRAEFEEELLELKKLVKPRDN